LKIFKLFRREKGIIKAIKYKAEIIRSDKEEWEVLDKVVRVMGLGETEEVGFTYRKYKHLDLSNLQ
jgi:hypothetical protein